MSYAPGAAQRRRSAYAARMAAKRQRQKYLIIGCLVVLAALLAYEVPHTLHLVKNNSPSASATPPAPVPTPAKPRPIPATLRGSSDPFDARALSSGDAQALGETPGHDPFAAPGTAASAPAPPPVVQPASVPLPQQIVIGTPGKGRVAVRGWIVILASIPTAEGRASAASFANRAARNVGALQILNSSNRRPLRGGYWVVYTGPFNTLTQVTQRVGSVHSAGYPTAYIRELIVYKAKA